jgi:hypothetical protein
MSSAGMLFPNFLDSSSATMNAYGIDYLHGGAIIDQHGNVIWTGHIYTSTPSDIKEKIDSLIE